MKMKECEIARKAAVRLAGKLYGRRIKDSIKVITSLKEGRKTFAELLAETSLSRWRLWQAIRFLIELGVVGKEGRSLYALRLNLPEDIELFLAMRAAFRL